MANNKNDQKDNLNNIKDLANKSNLIINGMDNTVDDENESLSNIVKNTIIKTSEKYGNRLGNTPIDYFSEINYNNIFSSDNKDSKSMVKNTNEENVTSKALFKKYMEESNIDVSGLLLNDRERLLNYRNYHSIYDHIPECATALDIYKDNILSPDDFTKIIFNIKYDDASDNFSNSNEKNNTKKTVEKQLKDICEKYKIDDLADSIIFDSLVTGDEFVAVLSLNDELGAIMNDPIMGKTNLNESIKHIELTDPSYIDKTLSPDDIELSDSEFQVFNEAFNTLKEDTSEKENKQPVEKNIKSKKILIKENSVHDSITKEIADMVNENVKICSLKEMLTERLSVESEKMKENSFQSVDIDDDKNDKSNAKKKKNSSPLNINGSIIRVLSPEKVVELKVDDIVYGYFYIEGDSNPIPNTSYLGASSGSQIGSSSSIASDSMTTSSMATLSYSPALASAALSGVSTSKLEVISQVFLNTISKKIDKEYIRHNKDMREFLYNLLRQEYIIKKAIKITFFTADEVIHFEVPAVYTKIVFFAKLYLSMLTNMIIIKMGRAHDKRVFNIDIGIDNDYEQAVSKVIQDVKTKEFKMDNLGDINTLLRLNPGTFDNYYLPVINGNKPVEIDTLAGMDIDMNNDFLEFLKNSMLNGMGIPQTLIDNLKNTEFARTLSSQNANFVRSVIKYQKKYTYPFTNLLRKLYTNEYKYNNDKESNIFKLININKIKVEFPSPATLNQTNMSDQIQAADTNADAIASALIPPKMDASNEDDRIKLKNEVVKDLLPGIDWNKYEKIRDTLKSTSKKEEIDTKAENTIDPTIDPNSETY